jgi:hypothetical protein
MATTISYYSNTTESLPGGPGQALAELRAGRAVHIGASYAGKALVAGTTKDPQTGTWTVIHELPRQLTFRQALLAAEVLSRAANLVHTVNSAGGQADVQ